MHNEGKTKLYKEGSTMLWKTKIKH